MPTNRERFLATHDLPKTTSLSLNEIAKLSKMPLSALRLVYNKGVGAYASNPQSVRLKPGTKYGRAYQKNIQAPMSAKLSAEQWGMGRVYAFVMKSPKVFYDADRHIAEMYGLL
jgi:hypothetical protein